jgi:hypothetical protein
MKSLMSTNVLFWLLFSLDRDKAAVNFGLKFTAALSRKSASVRFCPACSRPDQVHCHLPSALETI